MDSVDRCPVASTRRRDGSDAGRSPLVLPDPLLAVLVREVDIQVTVIADYETVKSICRCLIDNTRRRDGGGAGRSPLVLPDPLLAVLVPEVDIQVTVIADYETV